MPDFRDERSPLLRGDSEDHEHRQLIEFHKEDRENPKTWSRKEKLTNIGIIALMALMSPLASSMLYERRGDAAGVQYYLEDEDSRPIFAKLAKSIRRPLVIFMQPIILTMSLYQALIFGTTYSIYTNMQDIYSSPPYSLNTEQLGLLYLAPGLGFLTSVWFLVPKIDNVYNALTRRHNGKALPEYRLPLANIGSILIPISLFAFAWTVEYRNHVHWFITIFPTYFYGIGQAMIMNTVQNYYIDSFSKYAASAIAAGAVFRSLLGGVVPLFAPVLFDKLGYGWGISVFAFLSVVVAPSPVLFYYFGERLRERYQLKF